MSALVVDGWNWYRPPGEDSSPPTRTMATLFEAFRRVSYELKRSEATYHECLEAARAQGPTVGGLVKKKVVGHHCSALVTIRKPNGEGTGNT